MIDLRTCIGCHACSVACKAEFDVPLGAFRDTAKYVLVLALLESETHQGNG